MQLTRKQQLASTYENDIYFTDKEFWQTMKMFKDVGLDDRIKPSVFLFNLLANPAVDELIKVKIRIILGATIYTGSSKSLLGEDIFIELARRSESWAPLRLLASELAMP